MKIRLEAKQNKRAISSLPRVPLLGARVRAIRMPSLAASSPPEVAGSTNLLRTMCCKITPQTDRPMPLKISAARRGSRLAVSVSQASPEKLHNCAQLICRAPINKDRLHNIRNNSTKDLARITHRYLGLRWQYASLWRHDAGSGSGHNGPGFRVVGPVGLVR